VSQATTVSPQESDRVLIASQDKPENTDPGKKQFLPWADLIRTVAIFLVITVHVSGQITNLWGKVPESDWFIANIYGGIARICVPLFFMISGYLLLPRSESLGSFYRRRMLKIVIPFIVWSLIYLGWYCGNHPGMCTAPLIQKLLFVQGTYYHLWFMYSLIGIYLILPVLRLLVRRDADRKILWYLIGLWLIFQSAFNFLTYFGHFRIGISAPLATGFVGFFLLGYLLGPWKLSRSMALLAAAAWVLATIATILGTYLLTRASGKFENYFYGFTTPNVIISTVSAFLLLKWISENWFGTFFTNSRIIRNLAAASFGIYLVHVLVIEILQGWIPGVHLDSSIGNPLWSIPLVCLAVFLISFGVVRLLQKIPVLDRIVPG
jgi:surface polysaccharide O-acyltransferase-like enzyme